MLLPSPYAQAPWTAWAAQLVTVLQPALAKIEASMFRQGQIAQVGSFTVANLPDASIPGRIIYVSDESGGATLAVSDGTNWKRTSDLATVS